MFPVGVVDVVFENADERARYSTAIAMHRCAPTYCTATLSGGADSSGEISLLCSARAAKRRKFPSSTRPRLLPTSIRVDATLNRVRRCSCQRASERASDSIMDLCIDSDGFNLRRSDATAGTCFRLEPRSYGSIKRRTTYLSAAPNRVAALFLP